jgi:hypothetical protein
MIKKLGVTELRYEPQNLELLFFESWAEKVLNGGLFYLEDVFQVLGEYNSLLHKPSSASAD